MISSPQKPEHDITVAIVGGGLSGLAACYLLNKAGIGAHLFEANGRLGGRILSLTDPRSGAYLGDLGPTWVWSEFQPIASRWLHELGMETYDQYQAGYLVLDLSADSAPERAYLPHQQSSTRLVGGPRALVDQLTQAIPAPHIHMNARLLDVQDHQNQLRLRFDMEGQTQSVECQKLIAAAPLRLMAKTIGWGETLSPSILNIMAAAPTWMSTQAKATIVYESPFWRSNGLSGNVFSRVGPLAEIHDHCGRDGSPAALFGFVGVPHSDRQLLNLKAAIIHQLERCFGEQAANPVQYEIKDWAQDPFICSSQDLKTTPQHPSVLHPTTREPHCGGRIIFAGAESAEISPGLIEGALNAAERAANLCQT